MIKTNQSERLVEGVIRTEEVKKALENSSEIKSKKKREELQLIASFTLLTKDIIVSELKTIDPNSEFVFQYGLVKSKEKTPILKAVYSFINKDGETKHCSLSFVLVNKKYELTSIGASS